MGVVTSGILLLVFACCAPLSIGYKFDFESGNLAENGMQTPCNGMGKWKIVTTLPSNVPPPPNSKGFITTEASRYSCMNTMSPVKLMKGQIKFRLRMFLKYEAGGDCRISVRITTPGKNILMLFDQNKNEWQGLTEVLDLDSDGDCMVEFMGYCSNGWLYIDEFELTDEETTTSSTATETRTEGSTDTTPVQSPATTTVADGSDSTTGRCKKSFRRYPRKKTWNL